MPTNIDTLPFDVFHQIASSLDSGDLVNLSRGNRALHSLLEDESISRISLQAFTSYTKEARKAQEVGKGFRNAIGRIHDIRTAFAAAQPYSTTLLAFGDTFIYSQGVLCYLDGGLIRVLNVHELNSCGGRVETVIDARAILVERQGVSNQDTVQFSLLHYNEDTLVCLCELEERGESWLVVFDVSWTAAPRRGCQSERDGIDQRVRLWWSLHTTTKLFVRTNKSYLYFGTHTAMGSHGHHEWVVQGVDLLRKKPVTDKPIQLKNFVGSDLGLTVCFEIHGDHFYALSNQTCFETEEIDWTSYYHYTRISLDDSKADPTLKRIWRRQHVEGPINDSWTDLSLRLDEQDNELLIVECRKEWLGGGSANIRTYYSKPLTFPSICESPESSYVEPLSARAEADQSQPSSSQAASHGPPYTFMLPSNDILTTTLDENSKPNYEPAKQRMKREFHPEYSPERLDPCSTPPRDFILAKTKFRTYNPSASAFVDLVNDPVQKPGSARLCDRLRLRIGSRKKASPLIEDLRNPPHLKLRPQHEDHEGKLMEGSEDAFGPTTINLWPPDHAPGELYDLLCPGGRAGQVDAVSDDRSVVYMTGPPSFGGGQKRAIVLINFDPTLGYKELKRLRLQSWARDCEVELERAGAGVDRKGKARAVTWNLDDEQNERPAKKQRLEDASSVSTTCQRGFSDFFWQEQAMYLDIGRGYWLR